MLIIHAHSEIVLFNRPTCPPCWHPGPSLVRDRRTWQLPREGAAAAGAADPYPDRGAETGAGAEMGSGEEAEPYEVETGAELNTGAGAEAAP